MSWPAYKTQMGKKFERNDELMLSIRASLLGTSSRSETTNIRREVIVRHKIALENLVEKLDELIAVGAPAVAFVETQYNDPTLNAGVEYTAVRNAANQLASWIGGAVPDNTDITTYDSASGSVVHEEFTSAQLATFRTNVATFAATIEASTP